MLLTDRGIPAPPAEVLAALARVDNGWGLEYSPFENCFRFTQKWKPSDPRWERVRSGEEKESEARDWRGPLPLDCSLEEAFEWFQKSYRTLTDVEEITRIASRASEWNKKQLARVGAEVDADSTERLVRTSSKRTGHFRFDHATNELREEEGSARD